MRGKEPTSTVKIEDIEKILDKDYTQKGSADLALKKLQELLKNNKKGR